MQADQKSMKGRLMLKVLTSVFYESKCRRCLFTLASRRFLVQITPPTMAHIQATLYSLHRSSVLAFPITMVAGLSLAMARRYEATIALFPEGEDAASDLFWHSLCAFAPGVSLFPKYLERVE